MTKLTSQQEADVLSTFTTALQLQLKLLEAQLACLEKELFETRIAIRGFVYGDAHLNVSKVQKLVTVVSAIGAATNELNKLLWVFPNRNPQSNMPELTK